MSCPGLHCPGCSQGQSLGILAGAGVTLLAAYETVAVVAEYIVSIAVTLAVCFVLSVAAAMWLERLSDRRAARWAAARGIVSRADVLAGTARPLAVETMPEQRAIPAPNITLNFFGPLDHDQAEVIRRALNGGNQQ